ncbi:MAG: radical SAM protein [Treponema sp.]|nr:radical SAM protein [Treponema sp.]
MRFDKLLEDVRRIQKETSKLYIYGAGFYGKDIYRVLNRNHINIDGFIVTKDDGAGEVLGLPVIIADTVFSDNVGIVIGLSESYVDGVLKYIKENNVNMNHVVNGGKYITDTGGRKDLKESLMMEISTVMGCSVNCEFCPQDVLLKKYYENDKHRQRVMTVENFKTILAHTPDDCIIDFSGMTEPFLNPHCIDMIQLACDAGRRVYLFTTLSGVSEETVERLISLPVYYMTLHVADKMGYAYIPTTETYYRNVEKVIKAKKKDGRPFVDFVNAQTDPDERVAKIVGDDYEIMRSVQNRAGNLKDDRVQYREKPIEAGKKISCCFAEGDLLNNVALPDGTLVLCNMDYGMRHVTGNIYEEDYLTIRGKGEFRRVWKEMNGGDDMDLLCRTCLLARVEE